MLLYVGPMWLKHQNLFLVDMTLQVESGQYSFIIIINLLFKNAMAFIDHHNILHRAFASHISNKIDKSYYVGSIQTWPWPGVTKLYNFKPTRKSLNEVNIFRMTVFYVYFDI